MGIHRYAAARATHSILHTDLRSKDRSNWMELEPLHALASGRHQSGGATTEPSLPAPAVASALRILQFLANDAPRAGVTELARRLEINKSTCFNILQTLAHFGVVRRLPGGAKYQLGPKLAELGAAVRRNFSHRDQLRRHFEPLVAETGLLCIIGQVLGDETSFVIIDQMAPPGATARISAHSVGTVLPLTGAAMGCALLSRLDEEDAIEIVRGSGAATKPAEERSWRARLRDIRSVGFAISLEQYQRDVNAVATTIDKAGEAYLAVCLVGLVKDLPAERIRSLGRRLAQEARDFQQKLAAAGDEQ